MVDLTPYKAQIEKARLDTKKTHSEDPRTDFAIFLKESGYGLNGQVVLNNLIRLDGPEDKKGKKSGWYIYNEIPTLENKVIGVGAFGSWKTGERENWCSHKQTSMTTKERLEYHAFVEKTKKEREEERIQVQESASEKAINILKNSSDQPTNKQYLDKKKIDPVGDIKFNGNDIVIPIILNEEVTSLQFIKPDGGKKFLTGGRIKGCYFCIDGDDRRVFIAEGYSTGATIHMATGCKTYIAFNAGNLYEASVAVRNQNPSSKIIIAGDDDQFTTGNPGKNKAMQVADGLNLDVVFPNFKNLETKPTDFNDLLCLEGIDKVCSILGEPEVKAYVKEEAKKDDDILTARPEGVLGEIYDYYNTTSGNKQLGFSIQTALALGSIVTSRGYKTNYENFTSLYLLNVAKSTTGKEHSKTVIEKILREAGLDSYINGDGYTSAGAVFSALLKRPKHISVIDEFGRYLESGRNMKSGSSIQREANTKLIESITRAHGVMRPPMYSTMTLKKDAAQDIENRIVFNPAITLLTMTTPTTFFKSIDLGAIQDGFIGRFIVSISDAERAVRQHKQPVDVPTSILNWVTRINERMSQDHVATEEPKLITLDLSQDAYDLQIKFQEYCIEKANDLDKFGMADVVGRSNEMAMRVSLIVALSKDPDAKYVRHDDMEWAIEYVKGCLNKTIDSLKISVSSSEYESHKKEILFAIRAQSPDKVKRSCMVKSQPYSQHNKKYLDEILQDLVDADLIDVQMSDTKGKRGRPTKEYLAID